VRPRRWCEHQRYECGADRCRGIQIGVRSSIHASKVRNALDDKAKCSGLPIEHARTPALHFSCTGPDWLGKRRTYQVIRD
jgi:hypothetical protein